MTLFVPQSAGVRLRTFPNLEEFVKHQNNFLLHFMDKTYAEDMNFVGGYHNRPVVERFEHAHPLRKKHTTRVITSIYTANPYLDPRTPHPEEKTDSRIRFINQVLYDNYLIMQQLVRRTDPGVIQNGRVDINYLLS